MIRIEDHRLYWVRPDGSKLLVTNPYVFVDFYNRGLGTFKDGEYEWPGKVRIESYMTCPPKPFGAILIAP